MVGLTTAKALALGLGKPLVAVNHLAGHALTVRLTAGVDFPFLLLLVSGGHCQLLAVAGVEDYRLYGATMDDAVGEAFDKTAKLLGLPYPGGPAVEARAARGNAKAYALPRPLVGRPGMDFSFSGLKTAVRQLARQGAVAIDDALQGVTEVVRGHDLFWSTGVHRLLQKILDLHEPVYRHHDLIRDDAGAKLSKSSKATGLRELRAAGATPEAIRRRVGLP